MKPSHLLLFIVLANFRGQADAKGTWVCITRGSDGESITGLYSDSTKPHGAQCRPFDADTATRPRSSCRVKKRFGRTVAEYCMKDGIWYLHNEAVVTERQSSGSRTPTPASNVESRASSFDALIARAAAEFRLPEALLRAVIMVESGFRPDAVSPAGAQGLMQLMPVTADYLDVEDPFDPEQNIFAGARFIRILSDRFNGDIEKVVAAYFSGPTAVKRAGGIPSDRCARYVQNVMQLYRKFSGQ